MKAALHIKCHKVPPKSKKTHSINTKRKKEKGKLCVQGGVQLAFKTFTLLADLMFQSQRPQQQNKELGLSAE